jgi:hypothetical protein
VAGFRTWGGALHEAVKAGPEWEIDWTSLVPGRTQEQVRVAVFRHQWLACRS